MRASQRRLVRAQRDLSRKQPGSKNRAKSRRRLQRRHARVRRQRADHLHKITTHLARTKPVIVIEDLAVGGMLKSRRFSRSLADQSFGLLRRQLEYKCRASGARLLLAPRFFPSSKRCSRCGWIWAEMTLKEREFRCQNPDCGGVLDRDHNAALNLKWLGEQYSTAEVAAVVKQAVRAFEDLGCVVEEVKPTFADSHDLIRRLWSAHEAGNYAQYLGEWRNRMDPGLVA